MASKEQVNRLLALVPYLLARPNADLVQTAAVFAISPAQLVADLKVLWYCGLPDGLPGDLIEVDLDSLDQGTLRLSNADYLTRPLRFTPDEVLSLVIAVQAVQDLAGEDLAEAAASALAKLTDAAGQALPAPVSLATSTGSAVMRQALSEAINQHLVVGLVYDGSARGRTTEPKVEPARLSMRDGYAYLDAWSLERSDWRTYRLDRIVQVEPTTQPAEDRGDPPGFATGWLDSRDGVAEVSLLLAPQSGWIAEYIPIREMQRLPGGDLRVRLAVADPAWLRGLLLRLGSGVLEVDPPQAADSARQAARDALEHYREPR